MTQNPLLFSIVMPAFNAARTISTPVKSVLSQYYDKWELIVVNDGSIDKTPQIVHELSGNDPRISVVNVENRGVSAARNVGLANAKGEWILFLDADDCISPYYLVRAKDLIERDASLDAVYCRWAHIDDKNEVTEFVEQPVGGVLFSVFARSNPFLIHSCITKTSLTRLVGGFTERMHYVEDWDFWQRIARTGAVFGFLGDLLAFYKVRSDSASIDPISNMKASIEVVIRGHSSDLSDQYLSAYKNGMPADQLSRRLFDLLPWYGGIAIGRGENPLELLSMLSVDSKSTYDSAVFANSLAKGLMRALTVPFVEWPEIFRKYREQLQEFITNVGHCLVSGDFANDVQDFLLRFDLEQKYRLTAKQRIEEHGLTADIYDQPHKIISLSVTHRRPGVWGVTTLFNASRSRRIQLNYEIFSKRIRQQGLNLLVVELALKDQPFILKERDADVVIQMRSDSVLWHKERLLNIAISRLPEECEIVCWLDADVIFEEDDWVARAQDALEEHSVVQPYSYCIQLPPDNLYVPPNRTSYPGYSEDRQRHHSFGFGWNHFGVMGRESNIVSGHPGYAWAAWKRSIAKNGIYDASVIAGAGDVLTANAFVGCEPFMMRHSSIFSTRLMLDYRPWAERVYKEVGGSLGYVHGTLLHLWHGKIDNRRYLERLYLEKRANFDPKEDIEIDRNSSYRWSTNKEDLIAYMENYFDGRGDDDLSSRGSLSVIIGAYDDENGFRWCESDAVFEVAVMGSPLSFSVANNILNVVDRAQKISVFLNGIHVQDVLLTDTSPKVVTIYNANLGDRIRFTSDFEFRPSEFGSHDNRLLSFMLIS